MGETRRRQAHDDLAKKLANEGKLIEAGWAGLQAVWLHPDSPPEQVKDLRWAFMAGAQHLFASIMTTLDPGADPTDADLARMDKIAAELDAFRVEMNMSLPVEGTA